MNYGCVRWPCAICLPCKNLCAFAKKQILKIKYNIYTFILTAKLFIFCATQLIEPANSSQRTHLHPLTICTTARFSTVSFITAKFVLLRGQLHSHTCSVFSFNTCSPPRGLFLLLLASCSPSFHSLDNFCFLCKHVEFKLKYQITVS